METTCLLIMMSLLLVIVIICQVILTLKVYDLDNNLKEIKQNLTNW